MKYAGYNLKLVPLLLEVLRPRSTNCQWQDGHITICKVTGHGLACEHIQQVHVEQIVELIIQACGQSSQCGQHSLASGVQTGRMISDAWQVSLHPTIKSRMHMPENLMPMMCLYLTEAEGTRHLLMQCATEL